MAGIATSRLLKPKRDLWQSAWIICVMLSFPIFFSLYFLTIDHGAWVPYALAHLSLILLFAVAAERLKGAGIHLCPDGIREREYFSRMTFTPVEKIESVVVLKLRDSYSDDVSQQLFMIDAEGRTLLRMRGQLWHPGDFTRASHFYPVPVHTIETPMTWSELRRNYGHNLSLWERHPQVAFAALAGTFLLVTVPLLLAVLSTLAENA